MPTFRERVARWLYGNEIKGLEQGFDRVLQAFLEGQAYVTPEMLAQQLSELDAFTLQDVLGNAYWELISSDAKGISEEDRIRAVDESRRLYATDVISQWVIHLWTDFGFGETVVIDMDDAGAQDVFDTFWEAEENEPVLATNELHYQSENTLVDGEVYWLYFISTVDGMVTIRTVDTKEITRIVTHPDDSAKKLFYERKYYRPTNTGIQGELVTIYYPDHQAVMSGELDSTFLDGNVSLRDVVLPLNANVAGSDETVVFVQHIAHNRKRGLRGFPLMTTSFPWLRTHRQFRQDRASVAAAVAMYIQKIKVQGGSNALESVRRTISSTVTAQRPYETNPRATAGSTWLENEAAELSRLNLGTGAGDAKEDGNALLLMAGLGGGVFPHWLGAGDAYRLATATSMEVPLLRQFSRYQSFWSAQFKKMARIVMWAAVTYGDAQESYLDIVADVNIDKLVETDLTAVINTISALYRDVLMPLVREGLMPEEVAVEISRGVMLHALNALGVDNANDIVSDKKWIYEEPEIPPALVDYATGGNQPPNGDQPPDDQQEPVDDDDSQASETWRAWMFESHAPEITVHKCPLCSEGVQAFKYPGHGGVLVCTACHKTYDPALEG